MNTDTSAMVTRAVLAPSGPPQVFTLNLSQFREVYNEIQQNAQGTPVDILLNGDWAMVQFSKLCNHRIRIIGDPPPKIRSFFVRRKILTEEDFDFASLYSEFYGARTHLSLRAFLVEEVSTNWVPLLVTLLVSYIAFRSLAGTATGRSVLEKVNELLLTAATLYLSIFILFTVSQNVDWIKDPYLFRAGLTHRFFRVDRLLASLTIVVLCTSILNMILLNMPTSITFFGRAFTVPDPMIVAPVASALGVTILVDCFLALVQYYFQRVRYVLEKDLTKELMDEVWRERNPEEQK